MNRLKSFIKGDEGVTMIEYGLLAALIAVAVVVIITSVGTDLNAKLNSVDNTLK
jgi:pilus assembly protein Flp/PilA